MDQLFEQIAQLPLLMQMAVYAGIGWGIAYFARRQAGKEPDRTTKSEVVMSGVASITDMSPIRELLAAVRELIEEQRRSAVALEELGKAYKESLDHQRIAEEVERRVQERFDRSGR